MRHSFDRNGLGPEAVAVVGFRASGYPCAIAVPTFRAWNRHDMQRRIVSAVRDATASCRSTMLASPFDVTAQPRLSNVERMLQTMRPPAIGDGVSLVRLLEAQNGEASLAQCESVVASPFAVERIFGLMAGGLVEIELSVPIGAESRVRLRSSEWPFDWLNVCDRGHAGISRSLFGMSTRLARASDGRDECGIAEAAGLRAGPEPFAGEADHGP
ncbi:hypothetical protein [Methylobacterium sp. SI9]|uniref:hypothetical protein n=1 Tax=Methylobacterium guangdongense TaxID=3138811 RepID=UPI00313DCC35